jgi:hypothetical protein
MRAFIEFCATNHHRMSHDVEPIDRALELITAAEAAVEPDTIYGRRVDMVAVYTRTFLPGHRGTLVQERRGPRIEVPRRATADMVLDGRLDDTFWSGVPATRLRENRSGDNAEPPTTVMMAWGDNNSLYIGLRCDEPDMKALLDDAVTGMQIFNGDNIDILLETATHNYYQIVVSPSGTVFDMDRSEMFGPRFNDKWSAGVSVATHHDKGAWTVEIQIPAAGAEARELDPKHGVTGDRPSARAPWYINLGRLRPRGGENEFASLVPTHDRRFDDRIMRAHLVVE